MSKKQHCFIFPNDLSEKLDALTARPGTSKTAIVTDALRAWFDRRGASELDDRFAFRLDRLSRADARNGQKLDLIAEALGTFIHHQLTLTAHQPQFEPETRHLGLQRYRAFVDLVGRRLAHPDPSTSIGAIADEDHPSAPGAAEEGRET